MKRILILLALAGSAVAQENLTPGKAFELGRKYTAALYANDTVTLWPPMTQRMQESMGSEEKLGEFNEKARAQLGKETKLIKEVVLPNREYLIYTRLTEFEKVPVKIVVQFTFDAGGKIAGFFVTPEANPAESKFLDYKDKTTFT